MWRVLLLAVLLLCCSANRQREMDRLYTQARDELQSGELSQAETAIARGIATASTAKDAVREWRFRLLRCEVQLDRAPAKDLPELRRELPSGPEFSALAARQKMLAGLALVNADRFAEAGRVLDTAYGLANAAHDVETVVQIEIIQGKRLGAAAEWDPADVWLQQALKHAEAAELPVDEGLILINLGMNQLDRRHYDEAVDYFERATRVTEHRALKLRSAAQLNLGICYYRLGDFDRSIQLLLESVARSQQTGAKRYLEAGLGEAGNAYLLKGDPRAAAEYLVQALNVAKEIGRTSDAGIWAGSLSTLYGEIGDWDKAERFNDEAVRIKTVAKSHSLGYNTLNAAMIAVGRGKIEEGEQLYLQAISTANKDSQILWDGYSGLGRIAMLQKHPAVASGHFETAVSIVEKSRAALVNTESKLPFLARLIRLYQQYVDALLAQGDFERALAVADSSRAQVLAERFGTGSARRMAPDLFKKLARASGSTLVSYWLGSERSHVWVVTGGGIRHFDLPAEEEISALVRSYSEAVEVRQVDPLRSRIPAGEALFHILVEPLGIASGSRVIIVPDGILSGLNFETLPVPGKSPKYWIEDVTVAVAPSIGVLTQTDLNASRGSGLLLIGDPEKADPGYAPLAHAAAEMDDVSRYFDAGSRLVLRGKDAVASSYRAADPGRFAAIHFTAHATANRESPLDSAVLLSGGKLYAREVMGLPLKADLVTVSACRGAGSRTFSGEGLVGFAWAFLRAGARNVIAGLWDVNDQSTADLMNVTYRELQAGHKPQEALRTAKLALIRSERNFRKPYYWGPFQLYTLAP